MLLSKPALACFVVLLAPVGRTEVLRQLDFEVLLDSRPVGTHRFIIREQPGGLRTVESQASFDVRWLGLTALRYRHEALEHWQAGCLESIEATTRENGRLTLVSGAQQGEAFMLRSPKKLEEPGSCVSSYAYWDGARLLSQRVLLNPQTGELDAVRFEALGLSQGAQRYRLHSAQLQIDLWYSAKGDWQALESQVAGGRTLRYRLRD
jgi:Family of unknown function (DUF6134)